MIAPIALAAKGVCAAATASERRLRPAFALVLGGLGADVMREALGLFVLRPERALLGHGVPYAGWARAAFHADQALFLAWPFGVLTLSAWAWRRRWTPVLDAWMASWLLFAYAYPDLRGETLGRAYGLVAAGCVLFSLAMVALRKERAGALQLVSLLFVAGECATLAGPYLFRPFESWGLGQATWTVTFTAAALAALGSRWMRPA